MESLALQCSQDSKTRRVGAACGPQIFQPRVSQWSHRDPTPGPKPSSHSPLLLADVHRAGRSRRLHPFSSLSGRLFRSALTCPSRPLLSISPPSSLQICLLRDTLF